MIENGKKFRGFIINTIEGIVESESGAKPWKNNGFYYIRDRKGNLRLVSHIIYACHYNKSLKSMKDFSIKYKDKNTLNNKIYNLSIKERKIKISLL